MRYEPVFTGKSGNGLVEFADLGPTEHLTRVAIGRVMRSTVTAIASRNCLEEERAASGALAQLFTSEEVIVIGLARREALTSLREVPGIWRAVERMLGFKRPRPLASARLEALRDAAIRLRQGATSAKTLTALRTAGFSGEQVQELRRIVQRMRSSSAARSQ